MARSILAHSIHEHWATGATYDELHEAIKRDTPDRWAGFREPSFKFTIDTYQGSRSSGQQRDIINTFAYLPFEGPIRMKSPDHEFTAFEQWEFNAVPLGLSDPLRVHFGRLVALSSRDVVKTYDLKKRGYISRTSMDSELALVTANIALAAPGKLFYDPFVGTGSFPVACAHFGALGFGSDIDGRSLRGEGGARSLRGNFAQYGLENLMGGFFISDLTQTPLRRCRFLDGIICDPPYGVREGLRVLGCRDPTPYMLEKGRQMYK